MPSVSTQLPVNVPVNLISEFWLWLGPAPGVIEPAGNDSAIVVADDSAMVATPPSMPSIELKLGFSAAVPQAPVRSPVFGTISATLMVFGSGISCSRRCYDRRWGVR